MKLRTTLNQPSFPDRIDLKDSILTIGSCFSQSIGSLMAKSKMDVLINPFGTVYNPISIFKLLRYGLKRTDVPASSFVKTGDVFYHFDFHSDLSDLSQQALKSSILARINTVNAHLKKVNWLIITFGTATAYLQKATDEIVANCHKVPSNKFIKTVISVKRILKKFDINYSELMAVNPSLNIIVTVSPVRHVRDGLEDNSLSKSVLRVACEELAKSYDNVFYFPSYEIMMDDLRDYRFYGADMIHPTPQAEEYIWQVFIKAFFSQEDQSILNEWDRLKSALQHRPRHPESNAHKIFLKETLTKLKNLDRSIDLSKEIKQVRSRLEGN